MRTSLRIDPEEWQAVCLHKSLQIQGWHDMVIALGILCMVGRHLFCVLAAQLHLAVQNSSPFHLRGAQGQSVNVAHVEVGSAVPFNLGSIFTD